jgi:hypothetical protein
MQTCIERAVVKKDENKNVKQNGCNVEGQAVPVVKT